MAISSIDAGKTLCELSEWKLSNLRLQKLLYIAHMYHLGLRKSPLIVEDFEAWMYGPVEPNLYHHAKGFGSNPVRNVFPREAGAPEDGSEYALLRESVQATQGMSGAKLVSFTHWEKGAWYQVYKPKMYGIPIPNELILKEYEARKEARSQNG